MRREYGTPDLADAPEEDTARAPRIAKAVADSAERAASPSAIQTSDDEGAEPPEGGGTVPLRPILAVDFLRVRSVFAVLYRLATVALLLEKRGGRECGGCAMDKAALALVSRRFQSKCSCFFSAFSCVLCLVSTRESAKAGKLKFWGFPMWKECYQCDSFTRGS